MDKKLNDKYKTQDFEEKLYQEWEEKGYRVDIFREEPFTVSRDSVEGKYYVMIWKKGFRNQKVKIEEIL